MEDEPRRQSNLLREEGPDGPVIGYLLKGYARTSETFISNEIYQLENLGLRLSIFSLIKLVNQRRHAVIEQIRAPVIYLPQLASLSETPLPRWLARTLPVFARSHARLFRAQPRRYLLTLLDALLLSVRCPDEGRRYRKDFIKEFLQAGYVAQKVLEGRRIRHLHAHFAHTATCVVMFAAHLSGRPFSFTAHAKDIYLKELNPGPLLRIKMDRARFVVTCTAANQAYLRKLSPAGAPIRTIYHGLDPSRFVSPGNDSRGASLPPLLLSAGRLVEKKGFPHLVRACRMLKDEGREFRCQIVGGDGPAASEVRTLIEKLGLTGTIRLRPAVTQEELKMIYRESAMFVLACQVAANGDRDGIPNVLVEAMAMAMPVVSTRVSGIPELIDDGINGLLVPPEDAASLAAALARLMDDAPLSRALGQAAREKVCRLFDARVNARKLGELFRAGV